MASRGQHYGFQAATTSQPANGGHAYLFGNNGSENDLSEDDGEIFELRSRGRDRLRRSASRERMDDIIYLARDVQEGDTLNSLALHYHCSVRLSSLHSLHINSIPAHGLNLFHLTFNMAINQEHIKTYNVNHNRSGFIHSRGWLGCM